LRLLFPIVAATLLLALLLLGLGSGQTALAAPVGFANCLATPDDGVTIFFSSNAHAVQQAVDAAGPGATVKVAGTCAGVEERAGITQSVYISTNLTLIGGYANGDWENSDPAANPTVIDAQQQGRGVVFAGVHGAVAALTVQNGSFPASGSFACQLAVGCGGGIFAERALTLTGVTLQHNFAGSGGGAYVSEPSAIAASLFLSNTAVNEGGGLRAQDSVVINGSSFISNRADTYTGGGAHLTAATIINSRFLTNSTAGDGGGLWSAFATLLVTGTEFSGNSALSGGAIGSFFLNAGSRIEQSRFAGNVAGFHGGALHSKSDTEIGLARNQWLGNQAADGGALFADGWFGEGRIDNNLFAGNSSSGAGAAADIALGATATLLLARHNTHVAADSGQTALHAGTAGGNWLTVTNSVLRGYGIGMQAATGTQIVADRILLDGVATGGENSLGGIITLTGVFSGGAGFVDAVTGNYRLSVNSAAINQGVEAGVTEDFDGEVRPQSTAPDLGFDESPYAGTMILHYLPLIGGN
jgi:hypothetical protein